MFESDAKRKPDFFIIGAPRCGTSAMANFLSQHPDVFFSNPKEPYYFSRELFPGRYKNLNEYLRLYSKAKKQ